MKATIKTPSELFNGKRCGVTFRRGVAADVEVTDLQVKGFKQLDYEVIPAEKLAPVDETEKPAAKKKKPAAKKPAKSGE